MKRELHPVFIAALSTWAAYGRTLGAPNIYTDRDAALHTEPSLDPRPAEHGSATGRRTSVMGCPQCGLPGSVLWKSDG